MQQIKIDNFTFEIPKETKVIGLIAVNDEDIIFCMNNPEFQKLKKEVLK